MTEELPCNKQIALSYQVMWMDLQAICVLQGSSSVMNHDGFDDDIPITAHLDCSYNFFDAFKIFLQP
jgi:hypothetical protein